MSEINDAPIATYVAVVTITQREEGGTRNRYFRRAIPLSEMV